MKATVLIAGFERGEARDASAALLAAGACVLQTRDPSGALKHLEGGMVDAVVVSARLNPYGTELKQRAGKLGLAVLVLDPPLKPKELPSLITAALRRDAE